MEQIRDILGILEAIPDGIVVLAADGGIRWTNSAAGRFFGLSPDLDFSKEIVSAFDFIDAADRARAKEALGEIRVTGIPMHGEYSCIRGDGSTVETGIHAAAYPGGQGGEPGFVAVIRDRSEMFMREERPILRALLDAIPDEICIKDLRGKILLANEACVRAFDCRSPEDVIGKTAHDLLPARAAERQIGIDGEAVNSAEPMLNREHIDDDPDTGRIRRALLVTRLPLRDGSGDIIGTAGINRDITARKQMEGDLLKSQRRLALALESAHCGVIDWDSGRDHMIVNEELADMLGYSASELTGGLGKLISFVHPDDLGSVKSSFDDLLFGDAKRFTSEFRLRTRKGAWIWIFMTVTTVEFDDIGRPLRATGIALDISDTKEAREELRRSEERYRAIVESSGDAVFIIDNKGMCRFANSRAAELVAMPDTGIVDKPLTAFLNHKEASVLSMEVAEAIRTDIPKTQELEINFGKASRWVRIGIFPMHEVDGAVVSALLMFRDISEFKAVESDLISAKKEVENSVRLKDAIIANISHEIRTPLNTINGYSQILIENAGDRLDAEDMRLVEGIGRGGARLRKAVDDIVRYSGIQDGTIVPVFSRLDPAELLQRLVAEMKPRAQKKGLSLVFINECGQAEIVADADLLGDALRNLLDNALRYSDRGSVAVRLYFDRDGRMSIDVRDSGAGISESALRTVFEPYANREDNGMVAGAGIGLGLALVKRYLDFHGAEIEARSEKGIGTVMSVKLQEFRAGDDADSNSRSDVPAPRKRAGGKPLVLAVEDDPMTVEYLALILNPEYEIISADSAPKAKRSIRQRAPDIILMDISLKGKKTGIDLTRELRASEDFKSIPIVALTAHAFPADRDLCMEAGCSYFIAKPMSKSHLLDVMRRLLADRPAGAGELPAAASDA